MSLSNNNDATITNQSSDESEDTEGSHQASTEEEDEGEVNKMWFSREVTHIILHCMHMGLTMYESYDMYLLLNHCYSVCSMILALIGLWKNVDLLIMPVFFVTACNTIYAITCTFSVALISFESDGLEFLLNEIFYGYWSEKSEKFYEIKDVMNMLHLKLDFFSLLWNLYTCLFMLNIIIINFKNKRNQIIYYRNTIHEQRQQLQRESMLSQFPPPPSYQDLSDSVVVLSPPQDGVPPPDYYLLEREDEEHQIETPSASSMDESEVSLEDFFTTTSYVSSSPSSSSSSIY